MTMLPFVDAYNHSACVNAPRPTIPYKVRRWRAHSSHFRQRSHWGSVSSPVRSGMWLSPSADGGTPLGATLLADKS